MYQITTETAKAWLNFLPPSGHENSRSKQFQGLSWVDMWMRSEHRAVSVLRFRQECSRWGRKKGQFSTGDDRFSVDLKKQKDNNK